MSNEAKDVVAFWREAGPERWFAKNDAFDAEFKARFGKLHDAAARHDLDDWVSSPDGALALILLLDQFPRNCFRGTQRMFATDKHARQIADKAIGLGHHRSAGADVEVFFYLPFEHSEQLVDQDRCVAMHAALDAEYRHYAELHRDIIKRFGRFPHRNEVLGRTSSPEEQKFLDEGGFSG